MKLLSNGDDYYILRYVYKILYNFRISNMLVRFRFQAIVGGREVGGIAPKGSIRRTRKGCQAGIERQQKPQSVSILSKACNYTFRITYLILQGNAKVRKGSTSKQRDDRDYCRQERRS